MSWDGLVADKKTKTKSSQKTSTKRKTTTKKQSSNKEFDDVEYELTGEETIENTFNRPSKTKRKLRGEKTASYGHTGSGKTRYGLSWVRLNPTDVVEDIEMWNLPGEKHDHAIESFSTGFKNDAIIRGDPLIIIGTEISTEECLYGDDQWDMVADHVEKDILFKEVYRTFESGPEMGEEDPIACLREFNKVWAIILKRQPNRGTIMVDSGTSVLGWRHEYLRRKIMKKAPTEKEQGIPPRYWFWRNTKQESFQLGLRALKANTLVTWKMAKDKEGDYTELPRWHDDTSGHLSNNVLFHPLHDKDLFTTQVKKCRQTRELRMKRIPFPTATKFVGLLIHAFEYEDIKKLKV